MVKNSVGDNMKIQYNEKTYELHSVGENEEILIFKLVKEDKYANWSLKDFIFRYEDNREEIRDLHEEYDAYNERVEEFIYCGYNEEDPDFHGMILCLNEKKENLDELKKENENIYAMIDERFEKMDEKELEYIISLYDIDWW